MYARYIIRVKLTRKASMHTQSQHEKIHNINFTGFFNELFGNVVNSTDNDIVKYHNVKN